MILGDRAIKLRYSVYADCAIREITEGGEDIPSLLADNLTLGTRIRNYAKIALIMNIAAKRHEAFIRGEDPDEVNADFTELEFISAASSGLEQTLNAVAEAIVKGQKRTVFTRPLSKKSNNKKTEINRAWFIFYGHELGMSRDETLDTIYGEMVDNISLLAVYNRTAEIVEEKKKPSFDEIMEMR